MSRLAFEVTKYDFDASRLEGSDVLTVPRHDRWVLRRSEVRVSREVHDLNQGFRSAQNDRLPKIVQGKPLQPIVFEIIDSVVQIEAIDVECGTQISITSKRKSHEPELVGPYGMPQGINTISIGQSNPKCHPKTLECPPGVVGLHRSELDFGGFCTQSVPQ